MERENVHKTALTGRYYTCTVLRWQTYSRVEKFCICLHQRWHVIKEREKTTTTWRKTWRWPGWKFRIALSRSFLGPTILSVLILTSLDIWGEFWPQAESLATRLVLQLSFRKSHKILKKSAIRQLHCIIPSVKRSYTKILLVN